MPSTEGNDDRWLISEEEIDLNSQGSLMVSNGSIHSNTRKRQITLNLPRSHSLCSLKREDSPETYRTSASPETSEKEIKSIKGPTLDECSEAGSKNCMDSLSHPSQTSSNLMPQGLTKFGFSKNNMYGSRTSSGEGYYPDQDPSKYPNGQTSIAGSCGPADDRARMSAHRSSTCSTRTSISSNKLFLKVDELTEAAERCCSEYKPIYGTYKERRSRYSQIYEGACESAEQRSRKITDCSKEDIKNMREIVNCLFSKLEEAMERLLCRDFSICEDIIDLIQDFQHALCSLITHLRYSPYQCELEEMNNLIIALINDLELSPPYVLLRIVEFGYYLYEIGNHMREDLLPSSFAHLIHALQIRLYRLHTGRVIRQIYFVPTSFDPVLSTYAKSHRAMRVEAFCHCRIVLLPPSDPRAVYCPPGRRTIEVNFDENKGRFLGFANVLSRMCPLPQENSVRLVATVFRRFSGFEIEMTNSEVVEMNATEPRLRYCEIQSDLYLGTGLATAPHITSV